MTYLLSTSPYDFIFVSLSLQIFPPPFPPQTPVQRSDNLGPEFPVTYICQVS